MTQETESTDYQTVEKALAYLYDNYQNQPQLEEIAEHVALSPFHFQKLFQRWAGVSPKKFLQYLTLNAAKQRLRQNDDLLSTSLELGLSGPSRLHDLFLNIEGMTPGSYKAKGAGLTIRYGLYPSHFGPCFLAGTDRGLCALKFTDSEYGIERLKIEWPEAQLTHHPDALHPIYQQIFGDQPQTEPLKLLLKGTPFRIKVWEALLQIPPGRVISYTQLAQMVGKERAVRAVASAVAANPLGFLIPCHRVIRNMGEMGGYLWGIPRKLAMIGWEATRANPEPS